MPFSKQEALHNLIDYFNGDKLRASTFLKYLLQDKYNNYYEKTPDDTWKRLAKELARIENKYPNPLSEKKIYSYLKDFKRVTFQGSPMMGIGNNYLHTSLSNCIVINSPEDTMSSIIDTARDMANLFKRRCGVGIDISSLRPEGSSVNNSAKTSTGAWSFAELYSDVAKKIGQNGRRAALMLTMDIRHPDALKFAQSKSVEGNIKYANISLKTTDEFFRAVVNREKFIQQWPVDSDNPKVTKEVDAEELFNSIVELAHKTGDPGLLLFDNIRKWLPADCYPEFKTISTNPCLTGDMLIAVADGRNAVSIKELAEEGKDVPVYSVNPKDGKVSIQIGRNPRITGLNRQIVKVTLDDGSHMKVTSNHEVPLLSGKIKLAKDLSIGDSLHRFTKLPEKVTQQNNNQYYRVYCNTKNPEKDKIFEHRLIAKFYNPREWKEKYENTKQNGWHKGGIVVHHKDYNTLNNNIDNLSIMSFKDHQVYHANKDNKGSNNGRYSGFTNKQIEQLAIQLTRKTEGRFSRRDWHKFCIEKGCPKEFSNWRKENWFNSIKELSIWAANTLGYDHNNTDPRVIKTLNKMLKQGYKAKIKNNSVYVLKTCETCHKKFYIVHTLRETSFCNRQCSTFYINSKKEIKNKRKEGIKTFHTQKQKSTKVRQIEIYSTLKFKLNRIPLMKEWEEECRKNNCPYRLRTRFGFKNFKEIKETGDKYNHKVVSVEFLDQREDVYNITVDNNHTVGIITNIKKNKYGNYKYNGVYVAQCGELPLSQNDSCRLVSQPLTSYVSNPFTKTARFEFKKLYEDTCVTQRLADDLVDLELEKLANLIEIADTPDERALFQRLYSSCERGRRTGVGTQGLADVFIMLGIKYGSEESVKLTEKIYNTRANASYTSSAFLAAERGPFPAYSQEIEEGHIFIEQLDEVTKKAIKSNGRRNIANLTNAPTGSIAIVANTSAGIDPNFSIQKISRKKRKSHDDPHLDTDYIDQFGERWEVFELVTPIVQRWIKEGNDPDNLPDYFIESNNVDIDGRLHVQAAAQRWIDHSISNTFNLPRDTTIETVKDIYLKAWKYQVKGVTVFVDGCKEGVLNRIEPKKFTQQEAVKRPEIIECEIHKVRVKKENWTIIVGLIDNKPYEVFGGLSEAIEVPNKTSKGKIKKICYKTKPTVYHLELENGFIIKDIGNIFNNDLYQVHTRMVSLGLRHGALPSFIAEQLQKDKSDNDLTSFSKVLARVLKNYISNGTIVTNEKTCKECGNEHLIYQDGCPTCMSCGNSKCN